MGAMSGGGRQPLPSAMPSPNVLSRSGARLWGNNLTHTGRAIQKHGNRAGSAFPQPPTKAADLNQVGQQILDTILYHPDSSYHAYHHKAYGPIIEVRLPDGRGARFRDAVGFGFIGFIEP